MVWVSDLHCEKSGPSRAPRLCEHGSLNTLQHKALLTESVSPAYASSSSSDKSDDDHLPGRRGGRGAHHHRSGGGPGDLIGGMMAGLFGRR
jgi:hypothetical protein